MDNKNEFKAILIICDGTEIILKSEYSVKEIITKIEDTKMNEKDSFMEIEEGIYIDPYKVSLIREIKSPSESLINI